MGKGGRPGEGGEIVVSEEPQDDGGETRRLI